MFHGQSKKKWAIRCFRTARRDESMSSRDDFPIQNEINTTHGDDRTQYEVRNTSIMQCFDALIVRGIPPSVVAPSTLRRQSPLFVPLITTITIDATIFSFKK